MLEFEFRYDGVVMELGQVSVMVTMMVGGEMDLSEVVTVSVPEMEWRIPGVVVVWEGCVMMALGRHAVNGSYPYCHVLALSIPVLLWSGYQCYRIPTLWGGEQYYV